MRLAGIEANPQQDFSEFGRSEDSTEDSTARTRPRVLSDN
jgi:hypothetical protein